MAFDIFAKLTECISDYDNTGVTLATGTRADSAKYLSKDSNSVEFSQLRTLNKIDFAMNSVFESGLYDTEGQRKVYLNIVRFIQKVSRMRTDIDVKNYVFNPDTQDDQWPVYFMSRKFKIWARENDYGDVLNRLGDDYSTYGTAVLKRVGKEMKRVPLKTLRNTQDAETLKDAVKCGGYVIEEHEMSVFEMQEMKGWNTKDLDKDKKHKVYEIYTLMPKQYVADQNKRNIDASSTEWVQAMAVVTMDMAKGKEKPTNTNILFIEEIDEAPYEEARWDTIDGRWLGRGPVEDQLENQIARNMTANLRRRALLHSSKHVYYTNSEEGAKNLVKEVRDGQVMYLGPNGQITPVSNETRNIGEFTSDENVWDKNSQQMSFTFESATGESMPSGTPFSLGVLLSTAVESHFQLKKEQFGLFLKRSFFTQLMPIFQKQTKAHNLAIVAGEEGINWLKDSITVLKTNERYLNEIVTGGEVPDYQVVKAEVEAELNAKPFIFTDIPEGYYKDIKYHMELDITDEATDTQAEVQTLTTLYQSMVQAQDPRSDRVLEALLSKTGKNLKAIAGAKPAAQPMMAQMEGQLPAVAPAANASPAL